MVAFSIASLANDLLAANASRPTPRNRNSQPNFSLSSMSLLTLSGVHSWLEFSIPSVVMITITFSPLGKRRGESVRPIASWSAVIPRGVYSFGPIGLTRSTGVGG